MFLVLPLGVIPALFSLVASALDITIEFFGRLLGLSGGIVRHIVRRVAGFARSLIHLLLVLTPPFFIGSRILRTATRRQREQTQDHRENNSFHNVRLPVSVMR
jgi:hypothetical protein